MTASPAPLPIVNVYDPFVSILGGYFRGARFDRPMAMEAVDYYLVKERKG